MLILAPTWKRRLISAVSVANCSVHQKRINGRSDFGDSIVGAGYGNMVLPLLGLNDEARTFYEFALNTSASTYVMPGLLGVLAASMGDRDAAFAHFDQALDERSMVISWLRDPLISDIRDDPRYAELFERVGLTP
jgi:hypothetical protein